MMKSHDLEGFTNWEEWTQMTPIKAPKVKGVYVFRLAEAQMIGRLKGQSDLIYIGTTHGGKQTLQSRLKQHATPRGDGQDTGVLLDRVVKAGKPLEISWRICESGFLAQLEEAKLLDQFERDHLELPPLNNSRPLKKVIRAAKVFQSMPQERKDSILLSLGEKARGTG